MARRPKMPRAQHPDRVIEQYRKELWKRVAVTHRKTMQELEPLLQAEERRQAAEAERKARGDSPSFRLDANPAVSSLVKRLQKQFSKLGITALVDKIYGLGSRFSTEQVLAQLKGLVSIPAYASAPMKGLAKTWTAENVALIKSIDERYFSDVERVVEDAFAQGRGVDSLRKELQERYDVSRSRADLIARDQIGKLNSDVREERHRSLGITKYTWETTGDERVRESHAELDGKVFSYDDPPVINENGDHGHPGDDFQCRCIGTPLLPDESEDV